MQGLGMVMLNATDTWLVKLNATGHAAINGDVSYVVTLWKLEYIAVPLKPSQVTLQFEALVLQQITGSSLPADLHLNTAGVYRAVVQVY